MYIDIIVKKFNCVVQGDILTPTKVFVRYSMCRGWSKTKILKEVLKLNWNFQGCGRVQTEKPSGGYGFFSSNNTYHPDKITYVASVCILHFFLMFFSLLK